MMDTTGSHPCCEDVYRAFEDFLILNEVLLPDDDDVRTVTFVAIHAEEKGEASVETAESNDIARLKERIKDLERQTSQSGGDGAGLASMGRHRDSISSVTRGAMMGQDSLKSLASQAPAVKVHSDVFGTHEILSVDDNLVNHMVVENALEPKGFVVTVCMSGIEALELIKSRDYLPDLILLDCMMPEMNGYETCEQIRQAFPYIAIPVIMVSAKDHEADVVMGLKSGCNDYLKKPYGTNELIARINVHLKLRQLWNSEVQRHISKRYRADVQIPDRVVSRFSAGADTMLDKHTDATVLVLDLVDILEYVDNLPASEFTVILNKIYSLLDRIVKSYGATRIIDDTYMVVLGDGTSVDGGAKLDKQTQAALMLKMAAEMLEGVRELQVAMPSGPLPVRIQIGVAAGQAYSALVGIKQTYYTYFGTAVREACELLVRGHPMCVHLSSDLQARLGPSEAGQLVACGEYSRTDETTGEAVRRRTFLAKLGAFRDFVTPAHPVRQFAAAIPSGEIPTKPWLADPEPEMYLSHKTARHYRAFIRALSSPPGVARGGSFSRAPSEIHIQHHHQLQELVQGMEDLDIEDAVEARVLQLCLPETLIPQALMEREAGSVLARHHPRMSILVSNIVAYTSLSSALSAEEMVLLTNRMIQRFELLTAQHEGCVQIESSGGMFAVAAGHFPDAEPSNHAETLVRLGLEMIEAIGTIEFPRAHHKHLQCRIGIHTGDAKSGVIWSALPRYSFFGDTMITARGLEATGYAMCIHVSGETRKELQGAYEVEALGKNTLKGKGAMDTFLVKDARCAWESAIIKAHHQQLVSDSSAAQQILAGQSLHSAAASFNVPFTPKADAATRPFPPTAEPSNRRRSITPLSPAEIESSKEERTQMERTPSEERRSSLEQEWNRLGLKYSRAHTPDIDMVDSPDAPAPSRDEAEFPQTIVSPVHRLDRPPSMPLGMSQDVQPRAAPDVDERFKQEVSESMLKLSVDRKRGLARCQDCALNLERAEDALWALDLLRAEHEKLAKQCSRLSNMLQSGGGSGARRLGEGGAEGALSEEQQGVEEVVDEFLFKQFIRQAHIHHEEIEEREALHHQERQHRDAFTISVIRDFASLAAIPLPDVELAPVDEAFHEAAVRAAEAAAQGAQELAADSMASPPPRFETNGAPSPPEQTEAADRDSDARGSS